MNRIAIEVKSNPSQAPNYNTNGEGFAPATLQKAIIVRNGTESGNDTVDLQFVDKDGNKFVALVTARILKTLAGMTFTDGQ